ncbi:MAG: cytochrome C biogenesis protein [Alphaproteobacteria bacterium]|nr:cytochrome C biogenesis protein [Alphaproteobacteria bacterium]
MAHLETWLSQVSLASPLGFALMGLAGLVMGIAPSSYPLATVVAGYVGGQREQAVPLSGRGLLLSAGFVLGVATVDAVIGALVGFLGFVVIRVLAGSLAITNLVLGLFLLLMGLALLRKIRFLFPVLSPAPHRVRSFATAYALGVPFGLSVCPACTPIVLPVLGVAALSGTPWLGGALLLVFGIARGLPLLVVGAAADRLKDLPRLMMLAPKIERASGVLLLLASLYFFYQSAVYGGIAPSWGVFGTP